MKHKTIHTLVGWGIFAIALLVYLGSMAPTVSFWDCGEFVACANELEVPHPPGAPFFLLLGRLFAMLSFGNAELVPFMVNLVSVLASAFSVLLIFWTIILLAKKMMVPKGKTATQGQFIAMLFAGAVGALACTFSESFWFNAVEAEVYALSSLFTAVVVWLIFKWDEQADEPHATRFLILIAFVMGVSIGVHLLNLLTIPALAFVVYLRKFKPSVKGVVITTGISVVLLGAILYGLIQYSMDVAWWFEKWFTGGIEPGGVTTGWGLPFGFGATVFLILLFLAQMAFIAVTLPRAKVLEKYIPKLSRFKPILHTVALGILVVNIGYSSYSMIVIRAAAGPAINENDPSNVLSLMSYLKREQYGDRPLATGPLYQNYLRFSLESGAPMYSYSDAADRYQFEGYRQDPSYRSDQKVVFPRMWSVDHFESMPHGYKNYVSLENQGHDKKSMYDDTPSNAENLRFFFDYQVRHMYMRYFMWNFAGRQGDAKDMSWESGLELSKLSKMPQSMKDHPAKNHYFFLPLLLGLFGLVWQCLSKPKDGIIIGLLFLCTGLAIVIYLNQTPNQPRERDYSYVGSFQTFCIWIGLGVIGVFQLLQPVLKKKAAWVAGAIGLLIAPAILGIQNWDDHTRHHRYIAPDSAYNLLNSCAPNGILITNGDNDTFPLWYLQEVEDVRTDVRVVNLSLLNTDWYIDQMRDKINTAAPLPILLPDSKWKGVQNSRVPFQAGQTLRLPVNKQAVLENGAADPDESDRILAELPWKVPVHGKGKSAHLYKKDLILMDVIVNNAQDGWPRPIYFSRTAPPSAYMGLTDYFYMEGLAYRLKPVAQEQPISKDRYVAGSVDKERTYDKVMNEFKYRELDNPDLYLDEHIRQTIIGSMRSTIFQTANAYLDDTTLREKTNAQLAQQIGELQRKGQGDDPAVQQMQQRIEENRPIIAENNRRTRNLLDFSLEKMPDNVVEVEPAMLMYYGSAYQRLGEFEQAKSLYDTVDQRIYERLKYYQAIEEPFPQEARYLSVLQSIMQQYVQGEAFLEAAGVSDRLYELTGDPNLLQYGNQLRGAMGG